MVDKNRAYSQKYVRNCQGGWQVENGNFRMKLPCRLREQKAAAYAHARSTRASSAEASVPGG